MTDAKKVLEAERGWQPMDTAPKGANGIAFMMLAYGPEDDQTVGCGMRIHDKFYAASPFYNSGQSKRYVYREHEVNPNYWQPIPTPPTNKGAA